MRCMPDRSSPVDSRAAFGEEKVEELARRAAIAFTEGVREVRVVIQVCDSLRQICLGHSLEPLEAVNFRGDMVHRWLILPGGRVLSNFVRLPALWVAARTTLRTRARSTASSLSVCCTVHFACR